MVEVYCDVCGISMTDKRLGGITDKGLGWSIKDDFHKEAGRVQEIFGKTEFSVCHVCFLKSLGIKPLTLKVKEYENEKTNT